MKRNKCIGFRQVGISFLALTGPWLAGRPGHPIVKARANFSPRIFGGGGGKKATGRTVEVAAAFQHGQQASVDCTWAETFWTVRCCSTERYSYVPQMRQGLGVQDILAAH